MTQVVAVFDSRDALLRGIATARDAGLAIETAFLPAYDEEVMAASGVGRSPVGLWTIVGGIVGALAALAFMVWTVRQWPALIVSGKPLVPLPTFLIIAFEATILFAACAAVASMLAAGRSIRRIAQSTYDQSFSNWRFALLLACPPSEADSVGTLLIRHGAAAWRVA